MNAYELKDKVEAANEDGHYFTRCTMKFFGDTMRNYGVRSRPVEVTRYDGTTARCWELYRRKPVKHGMQASAFFDCETFIRVHPSR